MKILMINKYLYEKGGAETYMIRTGRYLAGSGQEVQYFGMDAPDRCVENSSGQYTKAIDFHNASPAEKITYPFRIIYSAEARKKLAVVLRDFQPDICHINNFNYQLTPSILVELNRWNRSQKKKCRIIYTAHDPQLVCPNHMLMNPNTYEVCRKCLSGDYRNCVRGRCIHGSRMRSILGMVESSYWHKKGIYRSFDRIICCSDFIKGILDQDRDLAGKTVVLHNYIVKTGRDIGAEDSSLNDLNLPERYILYFGRLSEEKGIRLLVKVIRSLPDLSFVIAGTGPLANLMEGIPNLRWVGFQSGTTLEQIIRGAAFTICPSIWYENCPFSVLESISCQTPVLGSRIGGIPELIEEGKNGLLFQPGDEEDLRSKTEALWNDRKKLIALRETCRESKLETIDEYCRKLLQIYQQGYYS